MKDITAKNIPKDAIYKDVVVIGNGPSGISLSYMLSGHWPYWITDKIKSHPDELLRARLQCSDSNKSLVLQDLVTLADGLEGRSTNPVSLLLDSLQNPCADLGMELPSMVQYKYHPEEQIDHVVLGKGPPGGSWHRMDPNLRTLSLSAWMSLPGLDFTSWQLSHPIQKQSASKSDRTNNAVKKSKTNCRKCMELQSTIVKTTSSSSTVPSVSLLNNNYIASNNNESECGSLCCKCSRQTTMSQEQITNINNEKNKIYSNRINEIIKNDKNQLETDSISVDDSDDGGANEQNNHQQLITTVLPRRNLSINRQVSKEVQTRALVSRVAEYYENYVAEMNLGKFFVSDITVTSILPLQQRDVRYKNARWVVYGLKSNGKPISYACKSVVLANGASDLANRLGLRGESSGLPWIKHELPELEVALEKLTSHERKKLKPVLVVGAGLSAADAVTICRSSEVPVIHVYRNKSAGLDKMLPENVYPEYHAVHKMMKEPSMTYDLYKPLAEHTITNVQTTSNGLHRVTVQHLLTGESKTIDVSYCTILIGSRPDLRFMSNVTTKPIEIRRIDQQLNTTNTTPSQCRSIITDETDDLSQIFNRKITWLKNLCAKCKHLNFCEWSRRNDYKKLCGHNYTKICECSNSSDGHVILNKNNSLITQQQQSSIIEDLRLYRLPGNENVSQTIKLGEDPTKPIDCKTNPIAVDKYTNEVLNVPKGLYSMGPLVGDNFVRFIPGGALAITSALNKEND